MGAWSLKGALAMFMVIEREIPKRRNATRGIIPGGRLSYEGGSL
jgi:hypothetical protein